MKDFSLSRLKKRRDFLRISEKSWRFVTHSFIIQMAPQEISKGSQKEKKEPRIGFTVTKRVGGAVLRNRARRRLKSAVFEMKNIFSSCYDYVIIARQESLTDCFLDIKKNISYSVSRLHKMAEEKKPFSEPSFLRRKKREKCLSS